MQSGTVNIFRYGAGTQGIMRTLGQYMAVSGTTFGYRRNRASMMSPTANAFTDSLCLSDPSFDQMQIQMYTSSTCGRKGDRSSCLQTQHGVDRESVKPHQNNIPLEDDSGDVVIGIPLRLLDPLCIIKSLLVQNVSIKTA